MAEPSNPPPTACDFFGQELPPGYRCRPDCPVAIECFEALYAEEDCSLCEAPATALDDCQRFGVAYFHKQHGGNVKVGGVWGGRELDGRTWDEFPDQNERRKRGNDDYKNHRTVFCLWPSRMCYCTRFSGS